ncbi:MAG: hypothetical protein OXI12_01145, partial [Gammaproteobacteria bacterium]|nr:hypothetical protein [Gammaproteobacteria bacterium]
MSLRWLGTRHDRRVLLLTVLAGLPAVVVALLLLWRSEFDPAIRWPLSLALIVVWLGLSTAAKNHALRPYETIANMLAALIEKSPSRRA